MIQDNIRTILAELPPNVSLVAAAKTRSAQEIMDAVEAGLCVVGENYIQEAEAAHAQVGDKVQWHMIGHLQRNKAKKAPTRSDLALTPLFIRTSRCYIIWPAPFGHRGDLRAIGLFTTGIPTSRYSFTDRDKVSF